MKSVCNRFSCWIDYVTRVYGLRVVALVLFLIQLLPVVYYYIERSRLPYAGEFVYQGISLISWTVIPVLLIALFPWGRLRKVLTVVAFTLYAFLMLFEVFLVYSYSSLYTDSIALNILATNPGEASAFLEHLNYRVFIIPLAILVLLGIGLFRFHRCRSMISSKWPTILTLGCFLPVLLSVFIVQPTQRKTNSYLFMAPVERFYVGTTTCIHDAQELEEYARQMKQLDLGKIHQTKDLRGVNVVVVIGESMRRDYMHCYGYPLANTPAQDSLIATGDLIPFTDVVSSASWTTGSVSQAMSFYRRDETDKAWYHYPSLPYVMSQAGYFSYWLSNQEKQGAGLQPIATLTTTADSVRFAKNRTVGDWDSAYDLELIPLLPRLNKLPQGKHSLFQVIHLMGSHTPYDVRSIPSLAPFTIDDLPATLPNGAPMPKDVKRRGIIRDYVNSIRYNDEVIRQIIAHFSEEPTLLVYFSDHGQVLFENPSRPDYYEHEVSLPGVAVPFLVYCSPSLRKAHPELYDVIQRAKGRRIMNDLFSNSLCGLLGIQLKYYESRYDFFSDDYDEGRKRLIIGYDGTPIDL